MTSNSDEDFSLKEWVLKRAANQTGAFTGEKYQSANGGESRAVREDDTMSEKILGSKTSASSGKSSKTAEKQSEKVQEKSKMTRFTNGVAPAVSNGHTNTAAAANVTGARNTPAQAVQQLQIVRLLQDLGERLRQSEKEREILWKELDGCRKLMSDIEDKTSKTEKAYITLENRLSQKQSSAENVAERQADMDRLSRELQDKIEAIEVTAGSALVRIEDAISENNKLSRRLEQVAQDKARLLRKLETMEDTLTQTQDALKAKALVLLTDQALAARTALPQTPAWSGNDTLRMSTPQAQPIKNQTEHVEPQHEEKSLFRRTSRMNTALLVALVMMGVGGGWLISRMQQAPDVNSVSVYKPEPTGAPDRTSDVQDQEKLMSQIATLANQVEPGATDAIAEQAAAAQAQTAAERADEMLADEAEKSAIASFKAGTPTSDVAERIKPDAALPKVAKQIETKALAGDAEAQHDLAAIYTSGHAGVKTNYGRAAQWFQEASYNNVANAQYNLGVLYHQGLGVKQDTRKAIQLYRVAAANGHPEAQYNLGIAHIEGVGADYSPRVAVRYFEEAASGGIVEAAYNLGLIQENGLLGEARPDEAVFWYKTAADEGNAQAKQALLQLQKSRKLSDQDIARIHNRIAILKPNAFNPKEITREIDPASAEEPATEAPEVVKKAAAAIKSVAKPAEVKTGSKAGYESVIVAQIQEQLTRMGLYDGPADGNANPATQEAVKSYQAMNKLKADGKPTEDVLVHMLASEMQLTNDPASGAN